MTRVFERLYLGNARDAEGLAVSNPHCITAVVNVNIGTNRSKRGGVEYDHFPLEDSERVLSVRFEQVLTGISQLIRGEKVLVHCEAGSSRSPVVVAAYMHVVGYKDFDDALAELRELRPAVFPSNLVIESAKAYLEELV